jgi:hypothetical protein
MGSIFGGKSGGSSTTIPSLSQEQKDYIKAQTGFFTNTVEPTYQDILNRGTDLYNKTAPGYEKAAQDYGRLAGQAGTTLGQTGESALRTGISGLENLFGKNYEQSQYMQNVANQQANFGSAGELGSARQALAGRQLAGATQAAQMQTAAQIQNNVANQRAAAAQQLAGFGQAGLGQAQNAYAARMGAAGAPIDLFNKYGTLAFGTPQASYTQIGPYGSNTNTSGWNIGGSFGFNPMKGG